MGRQLIFCVEADSESKTDYIYIKKTIEHFYEIDNSLIKLSPIYMGSKWKYNQNKVLSKIENLTKKYKSVSRDNETIVLMCVDCDDYDSCQEDANYLKSINDFCNEKSYKLVWFCKDIERVYWGTKADNTSKVKFAESFAKKNQISEIKKEMLSAKVYKNKYSNICRVLDGILKSNL